MQLSSSISISIRISSASTEISDNLFLTSSAILFLTYSTDCSLATSILDELISSIGGAALKSRSISESGTITAQSINPPKTNLSIPFILEDGARSSRTPHITAAIQITTAQDEIVVTNLHPL